MRIRQTRSIKHQTYMRANIVTLYDTIITHMSTWQMACKGACCPVLLEERLSLSSVTPMKSDVSIDLQATLVADKEHLPATLRVAHLDIAAKTTAAVLLLAPEGCNGL